jgi:type IV secretory pathway TraG/TraD family ATPase VirD4
MTNRRFQDAGITPFLAYFFTMAGFIALSFYLFKTTEFVKYQYIFTAIMLIGRLQETRRIEFLKIVFGDARWKKNQNIRKLVMCRVIFTFSFV